MLVKYLNWKLAASLIFSILYIVMPGYPQSKIEIFMNENRIDRDIPPYYDPSLSNFVEGPSESGSGLRIIGEGNPDSCVLPDPCNGIYFPYEVGPTCLPYPVFDPYGNIIHAVGWYGSDERQRYYVYYPDNKVPTSPVVLVVHGGGVLAP